ncbi:plant cysteine oxidase 2 [Coffea arabica]|uniref:cysteine dioxygenase n=1 Tax=Coffea arabica TaxID=13443 RepID=A0A6P6SIR8_COFAR|nr:plant cysteine oxidase 2-like [Coffea arabica]
MTMEAEAAGLVRNPGDVIGKVQDKIIRKKRCSNSSRRKVIIRRSLRPILGLQQLFLSCQEVFKGPGTVPSPNDVQMLCHILDQMTPQDVGLSSDLHFFKPNTDVKAHERVAYATIHQCKKFSLCIFFLPANSVIPLHNHPGMTVFSKLLLGSMHIKSYDWLDNSSSDNHESDPKLKRLARLRANRIFTAPCDTSVLYPTSGGNIHEFTAMTPCAVLDVLGPPYSKDDGRDCSYYKDSPYDATLDVEVKEAKQDECYGWLEEIDLPNDSEMDPIPYLGPQVSVAS